MLRWRETQRVALRMVVGVMGSCLLAAQADTGADYAAAVALYRSGQSREAMAAFARIDLTRARQGAQDLVQRRSQLGRASLLAAALLHMDVAAGEHGAPRQPQFAPQMDLAIRLLTAVDDMPDTTAHATESARLRGTRAVALMMLDDVSGLDTRGYAEEALSKFRNDVPLLTVAGVACETEGTGRWNVYSAVGRRSVRATEHGYLRDGRQYLERAIATSPDAFEAQVHLAHIDVLENNDRAAADRLSRLLARDPPPTWAYLALLQQGEIELRAGEGQLALSKITNALRLFPNAQSGLVVLSALLYQADNRPGAARVVEGLLSADPTIKTDDPWWDYRFGHWKAAETWLEPLRAEVRR